MAATVYCSRSMKLKLVLQQTILRTERLANALLSIVKIDQQRQAELLFRASDSRAETLTPESLRFIATAEQVASQP